MQMSFDFALPVVGQNNNSEENAEELIKENLQNYIKVCGLVAYKDFYLKIKNDLVAIPAGISKTHYLMLAREAYESRAAKVNRQKSRAKYFAIRNKNRKNNK